MHRLLIISRPRILFENNAPFPLYRSYVFPSPQTCSFRFIFLVPGCFPFLRLFIFLLAPSPCFLSSLAARFPSFHSPPPPSPSHSFPHQSRPRTSFVIFLNFFLLLFLFHPSFPYELNVHSLLPPPCFLPLSPLSLPLPPPRSLFIVLHVQFCSGKEEKGRRRRGEKTSSIRLRPPSFANLRVLHLVLLSLRVHLMHPSSGRERCHFGIFVFHLLPSPFESRPITFISIHDPSHFFRPFHGRLSVEAVDPRVQNLIIEKIR